MVLNNEKKSQPAISVLIATAKAQVSLCKCTDSPERWLLTYTKYGSRWRLKPKLGLLALQDTSAWGFKGGFCAYVMDKYQKLVRWPICTILANIPYYNTDIHVTLNKTFNFQTAWSTSDESHFPNQCLSHADVHHMAFPYLNPCHGEYFHVLHSSPIFILLTSAFQW